MSDPTILIWARVPAEKLEAFTQHIRDFDVANPGCEFRIIANAPDMPLGRMVDIVRGIAPNFQHMRVIDDDDRA